MQSRSFLVAAGEDPEALKKKVRAKHKAALVQTMKAGSVENASYVDILAAQTLSAAATGNLLANKPEIDLLLRIAGTTQISRAIHEVGTKNGEPFVLVIANEGAPIARSAMPSSSVELPRRKLAAKDLTKIERAALLNVLRA